jgi:hypothetical protein
MIGPEAGERAGEQHRPRGVERAEAQPARGRSAQRREVAARGLQPIEDGLRVHQQATPVVGEAHAARQPVEQVRAGGLLQRRDLTGDGRLCVAQRTRGPGHRAAARDLAEDGQPLCVHTLPPLYAWLPCNLFDSHMDSMDLLSGG